MTIKHALKLGTNQIGNRDTVLFLTHITGKHSGHVLLNDEEEIDGNEFESLINRRKTGEPLQYIIGKWEFMGHEIITDNRALIPRPETELLVEAAFNFVKTCNRPIKMLDLCTGTGCIAIATASLAKENAIDISITAADISHDALELAKNNATALGFEKIEFIQSNLFENIKFNEFDIIISNPPYIPSNEIEALDPVVRDHEPHLALDGGNDGMDLYRKIIPKSLDILRPNGALFLEIGPIGVRDILTDAGFKDICLIEDYAGIPRILYGVKKYV